MFCGCQPAKTSTLEVLHRFSVKTKLDSAMNSLISCFLGDKCHANSAWIACCTAPSEFSRSFYIALQQ